MNLLNVFASKEEKLQIEEIMAKADKESWHINELIKQLPCSRGGLAGAFTMGMLTERNAQQAPYAALLKKEKQISNLHNEYSKIAKDFNVTEEELLQKLRRYSKDSLWHIRLWKLIWLCLGIILTQLVMYLSQFSMQL